MRILVQLIFYPMLWLRPLFLIVGKILGFLFTLASLGYLFINLFAGGEYQRWDFVVLFGALGFGCFLLRQFYDRILLRLNPTGHDLILSSDASH
jgi:hypothetical protein